MFSYLPRQPCHKALIFLTTHTVRHDRSLVFLTLGNVHQSYFVRLTTGGKEKSYLLQWHFSHLQPASFFPALFISYKFSLHFHRLHQFSRAFHRFQTFPRFLPFTTFPAFTDGHMFSCTFYLTRFYFEFWFANLAACKASLVLAQWFLWGNSNSNNSIPLSTFAHHRLLSRFFNSRKKRSVFFNRSILALWTKDNREQIFLAALKSPVQQQSQPQ